MSQPNETREERKRRKAHRLTCAQKIFSWLLITFTVVLILSSLVELAITFIGFERNKKELSEHEKKIRILETTEVIFLVIELIYYFYGLYNLYYQKYHSIMCFGLSTLALTLVQLVVTIMLGGNPYQIVVHSIEIFYTIMVSIYGYLLVANRLQLSAPQHQHHIPPPAHPPAEE